MSTRPALESTSETCARRNKLLSALPDEEYDVVLEHGDEVVLPQKTVLYEPGSRVTHVYFLCSGMASSVTTMRDGRTAEIISVGREGIVGNPALMGYDQSAHQIYMQLAGNALRVPVEPLEELMDRCGALQVLVRRYSQARLFQLAQLVACNVLHNVEQRLARWLLTAQDCAERNQLPLTHEILAEMLGAQRTTVTETVGLLEQRGLIARRRGEITVLNRGGLECTACECYAALTEQFAEVVDI